MLNSSDVDTAFRAVRFQRRLMRAGGRWADPAFWRQINPELSITDRPVAGAGETPYGASQIPSTALLDGMRRDGCYLTPPVVPDADVDRLRTGITRLLDAGFPAFFIRLYDETYHLYARLRSVFAPVLGQGALMIPDAAHASCVRAGASGWSRWSGFPPHRDTFYPDPGVMAGGLPAILEAWVPLTNVTTDDSCPYILPAGCDPDYRAGTKAVQVTRFELEDVRAMPARAGSVLLISSHVVHWASRGRLGAAVPRVSITMMLQRSDAPQADESATAFDRALPFGARLRFVYKTIAKMLPDEPLPALPS